jgi:copper resistance protein C
LFPEVLYPKRFDSRPRTISIRYFFTFLSLLWLANGTSAHAILVRSTPKAHGVVASGVLEVSLEFNSRIDAARSDLTLVMPDEETVKLALLPQASPASLSARTARLEAGSYMIRWQVLANDGHITRGQIPFEVK